MKRMNKLAIALMLIAGSAASIFAIDFKSYPEAFSAGNIAINAGAGYGKALYGTTVIPPISATVDYALPIAGLPFSVGGLVGFTSSKYSYSSSYYGSYEYDYSTIALGARIAYHPNFGIKKLDTYVGAMVGYYLINGSASGTGYYANKEYDGSNGSFAWGSYIGARYFFMPNLAAFAELGAGFTYATLGASFKF